MSELQVFKDESLKEFVGVIDWGDIEIGDSKSIECYVYNASNLYEIIDIQQIIPDKDLSISGLPQTLAPLHKNKIKITFKPSLQRREALNVATAFKGKLKIV